MSHQIKINQLSVDAIIGVNQFEQAYRQPLFLDIEIDYDFSTAMKTDDISDTLDYAVLSDDIIDFIETRSFQLIESVAGKVIELIAKNPQVTGVTVTVEKPQALRKAKSVAVAVRHSALPAPSLRGTK